jgi:adenylate kinase
VEHPDLFHQVIQFIQNKIMPIVVRHAISGLASVNSEDTLLHNDLALAMLIDIFSERGFHAVVDLHRIELPEKFDLTTGHITCRAKKVFRISIRFQGSEIRRG